MKKQPIGIFDSGLGGLTILNALHRTLPREDLIYFGDTANVPYGSKSKEAVTKFSLAIARFLEKQGVKLIVAACNTASAQALGKLRKEISVPVMGVIEPGAQKAIESTLNRRIAVLGTEGTVKSNAYPKAILKRDHKIRIVQQACPLFVPLVEEHLGKKPATQLIARDYLNRVKKSGADTVILGCHDHPPFAQVCDDNFYAQKNCKNGMFEDHYIVGSLYPEMTNSQRADIMNQLRWDRRLRVKLKFSEMLRYAEKLQFTFMDFFGLDKTYNHAGTQNPDNWKLRLKKSYKEDYYRALEWQPGDDGVNRVALNMPEELKRPVIAKIATEKGSDFASHQELIDRLDYFEKMLKTPDEAIERK